MVSKGLFVVVEGIDGCGKTTQAVKLLEWIFQNYKSADNIILTREQTRSKYGIEISRLLREMKNVEEDREKLLKLFVLDRQHHVEKVISRMYAENVIILCDRYKYSTIAYQGAQGISVTRLVSDNLPFPVPDLVLIFDVSIENSLLRTGARGQTDLFDKKKEFLEKVREGYVKMPATFPNENIQFINANQSIEKIHEDVVRVVKPLIEKIN